MTTIKGPAVQVRDEQTSRRSKRSGNENSAGTDRNTYGSNRTGPEGPDSARRPTRG